MISNLYNKYKPEKFQEFLYFLEFQLSSALHGRKKKIAVIKQGGLGDYVIFTAFLKNLRAAEPEAHITLFAGFYCMDVWRDNQNIDRMIPVLSGQPLYSLGVLDLKQFLRPLSGIDKYYDLVYDPNHCVDYYYNGVIASCLHAKEKIAYKKELSIYEGYDSNKNYSQLLERPLLNNVAEYNSSYLEILYPGNKFDPFDTQLSAYVTDRSTLPRGEKKTIGIHPTSSNTTRHLTKIKIIAIIEAVKSFGCVPIIIAKDVWGLKSEFPNFIEDLSLGETFHLVSQLSGVICTDSGIKHIAGHYKIPTVEISHIPEKYNNLNGPYLSAEKLFVGVEYWRPRPDQYFHEIVKPKNIETVEDIASGKAINSFDLEDLIDAIRRMIEN